MVVQEELKLVVVEAELVVIELEHLAKAQVQKLSLLVLEAATNLMVATRQL